MIIDYNKDHEHARRYEIVDADTYEPLGKEFDRVFYADDSAGILRLVKLDQNGRFVVNEAGDALVYEEVRRRFRIVRKHGD